MVQPDLPLAPIVPPRVQSPSEISISGRRPTEPGCIQFCGLGTEPILMEYFGTINVKSESHDALKRDNPERFAEFEQRMFNILKSPENAPFREEQARRIPLFRSWGFVREAQQMEECLRELTSS
jgi:hypothetical protein